MGKAIIIGSDFSRNLGSVTFLKKTPLTEIKISMPSTISGAYCQGIISYTPADSIQREDGVKWEITEGLSYAKIDETTGLLEINPGISYCGLTIKATSNANAELSSTKSILVNYKEQEYINIMPTEVIFDPYRGYTDRQIVIETYPKDLEYTISCPSPFFCNKEESGNLVVGINTSEIESDVKKLETFAEITSENYSIKLTLKYERQS